MKKYFLSLIIISVFTILSFPNLYSAEFIPKSFKADFLHIQKSTLSGHEKIDPGVVEYKYPSNIKFEFLGKNKIIFVSNPQMSWYYTAPIIEGESGSLSQEKTSKSGPVKFFDILKSGLVTNKNYTVKNENGIYSIVLNKELSKEMGITKAVFTFESGKSDFANIKSIELNYENKNPVTLKFTSIKQDVLFSESNFSFEAPANTIINR